jgi:hypothetical protein
MDDLTRNEPLKGMSALSPGWSAATLRSTRRYVPPSLQDLNHPVVYFFKFTQIRVFSFLTYKHPLAKAG